MSTLVISFVSFLLVFVLIGALSSKLSQNTTEDYLLAGKSVNPWLAGLSGVASTCSGFMFIGLMGATFQSGVYIFWFILGLIMGNLCYWYLMAEKFFVTSAASNANTIPEFISSNGKKAMPTLQALSAILILCFLGTYAAAQLNAGSKSLQVLMGFSFESGAIIGAAMIVIYCFSGGLRASIWTDAAQSVVMILALIVIVVSCLNELGGISGLIARLNAISPSLTTLTPTDKPWLLYFLGSFFLGTGILGQPHVIVRIMTLSNVENFRKARRAYFIYYIPFLFIAVTAGLCCKALLSNGVNFDPELALPTLALSRLNKVLVGLVLAGVFSSTISTADSQVLACSASLTEDLKLFGEKHGYFAHKVSTFAVTIMVLALALYGSRSVFSLVILAWSALASSLGPVLILRSFSIPFSEKQAVSMMILGLLASSNFRYFGYHSYFNETFIGILAGLLVFVITSVKNSSKLKKFNCCI